MKLVYNDPKGRDTLETLVTHTACQTTAHYLLCLLSKLWGNNNLNIGVSDVLG